MTPPGRDRAPASYLLMEEVPVACLLLDREGYVVACNGEAEQLIGAPREEVNRLRVHAFLDDEAVRKIAAMWRDAPAAAIPIERFETQVTRVVDSVTRHAVCAARACTPSEGLDSREAEEARDHLLVVLCESEFLWEGRRGLQTRITELERFQRIFLEREARIVELKERLAALEARDPAVGSRG